MGHKSNKQSNFTLIKYGTPNIRRGKERQQTKQFLIISLSEKKLFIYILPMEESDKCWETDRSN